MKKHVSRRLSIALGALCAVLLLNGAASYYNISRLIEAEDWVAHTLKVRRGLSDITAAIATAEAAERGFAITGHAVFADRYGAAVNDVKAAQTSVRQLTRDNADQQHRLDALDGSVDQATAWLASVMKTRVMQGMDAALSQISSGQGAIHLEDARATVGDMDREENELLAIRNTSARSYLHQTLLGLTVFTASSILLALLVLLVMRRDAANRETAQQALFSSNQMLRSVLDTIPQRVFWKDRESRYLGSNNLFAQDAGYKQPEQLVGKRDEDTAFAPHAAAYRAGDRSVMEGSAPKTSYEEPLSTPDGTPRWVETSKVPLRDFSGAVIGVLGTYQDITARKHAERELERQANYDALTGLPNRNLLTERIAHEIAAAKRAQGVFAVAVVDLDNFKLANDGHGHAFGDRLLVEAAARLQATVRSDDTVARYGGDEFVLLLSCRGDERFAVVLERVRAAFSMPIVIDRTEVFVTCSIGASTFPQDGLDAPTLLSHADAAMYRAKEGGRNRFEVFEAEMGNRIRERISLEHGLRAALAEGQLLLNYQPQVNLQTGRVDGVEALTRWKHPTQGMISPARFIPVAEQSGLIIPMGEWILRTGCAHAKAWNDQTGNPLSVAVNLSALQFRQKGFVELVARTLAETGLPAEHLELEITESLLMSEDALGLLLELKKLGISLSIDDFGTGYSSLSYLRRLPIDKLKIDQSFVRDIPNDASAISIARAIILLSQSLGFSVIAEGVETKEQLEVLQALGCDKIQGYYFSKPVTDEELPRVRDDIQGKLNARAREVTIDWPHEAACRTA